jgi:phospholipase C
MTGFRIMGVCVSLAATAGLLACGGGSSPSQATSNFQISATPLSPGTVTVGSAATSTVTVTDVAGFDSPVSLACSGLPSGASCSFNPASVAGSGSSKLTVATSQGTTPGSYPLSVQGTSGSTNQSAPLTLAVQSIIQHIVVIFQENRSPDNLFQDPKLIAAGANIQNYGISAAQPGVHIPLSPVPLGCPPDNCQTYDPDHSHIPAFVDMYDNGKMDGAYEIVSKCAKPGTYCLNGLGNYSYAYVQQSDVAPYFQMAETYTFADNMFQSNQGPSFPAHQYLISGSSSLAPPGQPNSNLLNAELPLALTSGNSDNDTGCTAPPTETAAAIDPATGVETQVYPCFDRPTLTDLLNAKNISWKYYAPSAGSIWTAPNAISHMCGPNVPPPNATACTASDWTNNVVLNSAQVLTDISNNQLAAVSWVIPSGQASDHPVTTDGSGPSWVASVVNAIGNSPYWANTAILITWDDWGGWYDHVVPPLILNHYEIGFRVPLIVISPYAKANYISHTFYEFGSTLKFIENTFGLSQIAPTATLLFADQFPGTGDLSDCFDYNQTPLVFHTIPAPLDANFFLNDKRTPTDPDDD